MSEAEIGAPTAPAEGTPKPNPFQRIVGVLISPGETFESIVRRPDWVVPLLILLLVSVVGGVLLASRVDFQTVAQEAMEMDPRTANMSANQAATAARFTAMTMKISAYASPVLSLIAFLIVSGVLLMSFRLMAGEGTFLQAFSVTIYAWYPRLIKGILSTVVLLSRKSISIFDLQNPVMSNLGFLFDPKSKPLQFAMASSIDLFAIWSVILMVIGFAAMSKLTRAKSTAIVIGWWIVVNLLALIGPAMQALRK